LGRDLAVVTGTRRFRSTIPILLYAYLSPKLRPRPKVPMTSALLGSYVDKAPVGRRLIIKWALRPHRKISPIKQAFEAVLPVRLWIVVKPHVILAYRS
jgi:hypothetical protein